MFVKFTSLKFYTFQLDFELYQIKPKSLGCINHNKQKKSYKTAIITYKLISQASVSFPFGSDFSDLRKQTKNLRYLRVEALQIPNNAKIILLHLYLAINYGETWPMTNNLLWKFGAFHRWHS